MVVEAISPRASNHDAPMSRHVGQTGHRLWISRGNQDHILNRKIRNHWDRPVEYELDSIGTIQPLPPYTHFIIFFLREMNATQSLFYINFYYADK